MKKLLILPLLALLVSSCQTYRPLQVDLQGNLEAWRNGQAGLQSPSGDHANYNQETTLTLEQSLELALRFNPQFTADLANVDAVRAIAEEAGWWPDPSIEFDGTKFIHDSNKYWTNGVTLGLVLPVNGALRIEKQLAEQELTSALAEVKILRRDLTAQVREVWLRRQALAEQLQLYQHYVAQLNLLLQQAAPLADAGELSALDVRLLRIDLEDKTAEINKLNGELKSSRLALLNLCGLHPQSPVTFAKAPLNWRELPTWPETQLILNNPEVNQLLAAFDSADLRHQLELRRQYPDLELSTGYEDEQSERSVSIGFGLNLPLWNRNRQAVKSSDADRQQALKALQAQVASVVAEKEQILCEYATAETLRNNRQTSVSPLIDTQFEQLVAQQEAGEVDILMLTDVLERSLENRLAIIEATLTMQQLHNRLHGLVGYQNFENKENVK